MIKPYLIEFEDDDPNDTLKTKHNDQKNGYEEDHPPIVSPITIDSFLTIVVILSVAIDYLIVIMIMK